MRNSLHENQAVRRALDPQSIGAGVTVNGSTIDRAGYDEVRFDIAVGAITATGKIDVKVQHGDLADGSDAADITGAAIAQMTAAASQSDKVAIIRLQAEGLKKYVRLSATATTAAALVSATCTMGGKHGDLPENNAAHADVDQVVSVAA